VTTRACERSGEGVVVNGILSSKLEQDYSRLGGSPASKSTLCRYLVHAYIGDSVVLQILFAINLSQICIRLDYLKIRGLLDFLEVNVRKVGL
jgi:hypothetical protein